MNNATPLPENSPSLLDWSCIDTVLLDMDGTLLDLHYDNTVWNELVPIAYAKHLDAPLEHAKNELLEHMVAIRGRIEFYNFGYWSEYTGIDLIAVHKQVTDLIQYRPNAEKFLAWLQATGRQAIIATNADRASLAVKHEHSVICDKVDAVVSSHDYAHPKESPLFWSALKEQYPYDPARTLFIDDNVPVLDSAAAAGIAHLLCVTTPDSARGPRTDLGYACMDDFADIFQPNDAKLSTVRLDRWLWAARFFKTRSLAKAAVEGGKVHLDGQRAKPAKEVKVGQQLTITRGSVEVIVNITCLSDQRGPAKVAQTLYLETIESIERRESQAARRRMERAGLTVPDTKPSKKDRRDLRKLKTLDSAN